MHNLRGAFSESLYIYLETLKQSLHFGLPPSILSLGLGLAYNEMMSIAHFKQCQLEQFKIVSYEKDPALTEALLQWLKIKPQGKKVTTHPPSVTANHLDEIAGRQRRASEAYSRYAAGSDEADDSQDRQMGEQLRKKCTWLSAYEIIAERIAQHFALPPHELKQDLTQAIHLGKWTFQGALLTDTQFPYRVNCIFYDAFSEKTDPVLWNAENLHNWLIQACQPQCALGSYAAKGVLKRTLQSLGFVLTKRAGFSGKKQSTLAIRV